MREVVSPLPNSQSGGPPSVGFPGVFFNTFAATFISGDDHPHLRHFMATKEPLNMAVNNINKNGRVLSGVQ
jgi:hypothetical protein